MYFLQFLKCQCSLFKIEHGVRTVGLMDISHYLLTLYRLNNRLTAKVSKN